MERTSFGGVQIHGDGTITYASGSQPLAACVAAVEQVGAVRDRATITRVVGGALLAGPVGAVVGGLLRKQVDDRAVYLLVSGQQDWAVPVKPALERMARTFAATINTAAREQESLDAQAVVAAVEGAGQRARMESRRRNVYRSVDDLV